MGASLGYLGLGSYAGAYVWKTFQGGVSIYMGAPLGNWGGGVRLPVNLKISRRRDLAREHPSL